MKQQAWPQGSLLLKPHQHQEPSIDKISLIVYCIRDAQKQPEDTDPTYNIKPIQYSNGKSVFRGTVKSNKKSHRQSCYWSPHHTHPRSSDNRGRSRSRSFLLYISGTNLCKCDNFKPLASQGGFGDLSNISGLCLSFKERNL